MKKLLLFCAVFLVALYSNAQPPSIKVVNETDCMMYAYLIEYNASCASATHNVAIPPNSTVVVNSSLAGGHFELALVTDTFGPYDYSCYYVKVQVPWANCVSGYPSTAVSSTCCAASPIVKSTWVHPPSTAAQPYLFIYD